MMQKSSSLGLTQFAPSKGSPVNTKIEGGFRLQVYETQLSGADFWSDMREGSSLTVREMNKVPQVSSGQFTLTIKYFSPIR